MTLEMSNKWGGGRFKCLAQKENERIYIISHRDTFFLPSSSLSPSLSIPISLSFHLSIYVYLSPHFPIPALKRRSMLMMICILDYCFPIALSGCSCKTTGCFWLCSPLVNLIKYVWYVLHHPSIYLSNIYLSIFICVYTYVYIIHIYIYIYMYVQIFKILTISEICRKVTLGWVRLA